ncbi:hypothetical protein B566_EDAN010698 [Ephemera danica]|nr:hypothetical protein B566_EDAN010698 [Ephemera danica]
MVFLNMFKIRRMFLVLAVFLISSPPTFGEDFYELLGVSKTADNREIRKAFKKLAVTLHPDKNKDDSDAHDKFVKVARAYETLKDPDLRKRYDLYGEEDGSRSRQQSYQSWTYYHDNFGIYDDDPEIITLGRAEFEQSVRSEGGEAWFVNFYSAMCSHCHHLAPIWRRFARRVEGVVRVAAVNCEDDWVLCRNERVNSYPTLVYYPTGEMFRGERNEDALVEFVLARLNIKVAEVSTWDNTDFQDQARVLFFSDVSGDGPNSETRLKLAAMLDGLAWVGHVDCELHPTLCERLGASSGTAVWTAKSKGAPSFVPGLEAQELLAQVLALLPEPPLLNDDDFVEMQTQLERGLSSSWLLYFHLGEPESARLDLRRLPAKLPALRVGRVDCARSSNLCAVLHIQRYPVYGVFKSGGSYELHHGRTSASDVAQFARESATSPRMTTLTPQQFDHSGPLSDAPLLVDFFAPWCPPCLRLLPELRSGVLDLNLDSFYKTVGSKREEEIWIVDFFAPWCGPCQQLAPQWRKLAKMLSDMSMVKMGAVNCEVEYTLCQEQNIRAYPSIRLYPTGSKGLNQVVLFSGFQRDAHSLRQWVMNFVPSLVTSLNEDSFDALVKAGSEPWLIDFYAPWCGHCVHFAPEFELAARMLEDLGVKCGKVDCEAYRDFCRSLGVRGYPTVRLYSGPHRDQAVEMSSQSAATLVDIVSDIVKSQPAKKHDEL